MDSKHSKGKRSRSHSSSAKMAKDPELEAEIFYAIENGFAPPRVLPSEAAKKFSEALDDPSNLNKNNFFVCAESF